ncbi:MAG: hypothetical protein JRD69_09875, partial [Deltaproteobacteria bacterium]|nr:hypothetical protein [Deltaproteobacteria bacterium]
IITPVREGIAVAELTEKDIAFLTKETGIISRHIEFLVCAARLAKQTELPAEVFYGLVRQGLPSVLSDLLAQVPKVLCKALETSLDNHIIPARLRDNLDQFLERLGKLKEVDPGIHRKQQKEKIRCLGKVVDLDNTKVEAVLKKVSSPALLNDITFSSLVETGELKEDEAKELGLTVSLYNLFDENLDLTEAVKKGDFPQVSQGKVLAFDKADWLTVLKEEDIEPPNGMKQDDYAGFLTKKVENLYPSKALLSRMIPKEMEGPSTDMEELQPLFENNEVVFGIDRFDSLNLEGIDPGEVETIRRAHGNLKKLANTYPGLRISPILDDRRLSPGDKRARISERIGLLSRFQAQNPAVEFLALDYVPESDDIKALNFGGFMEDEQRMVLNIMKASQRMYSITNDCTHTKMLMERGYHSAFGMANDSLTLFMLNTGLDKAVAKGYYDQACAAAIDGTTSTISVIDMMVSAFRLTNVDNTDPALETYLKKFDGWEKLFGSLDYCRCRHCQSILSPAAYFVDLMRFVETNIFFEERGLSFEEGGRFARCVAFREREDHPLHLRARRPDLWELPLTCENTHGLIPYLDIINEILENYIAIDLGVAGEDLPAPGSPERAVIQGLVYSRLQETTGSFRQPFSLALEKLKIYLSHFDQSRGAIAELVAGSPVAGVPFSMAEAALNLTRREYELIIEANRDISFLRRMYGIVFNEDGAEIIFSEPDVEGSEKDVQLLLKPMGLTRADIGGLIKTNFVLTGCEPTGRRETITIQGEKRNVEESVQKDIERIHGLTTTSLDRMHRFTRLWCSVAWSMKELDLILSHMAKTGLAHGIEEDTLPYLVDILSLQKRFTISVEELCTLWSDLPEISVTTAKGSLFDRLFNLPDFVRVDGDFASPTRNFLHPAFRDTPPHPDEIDYNLHRLLAGLRVDDETLYLLIMHLREPLGGPDLDSADLNAKRFLLTLENLTLLYRHARLAERLKLSIPQLFHLIHLADVVTVAHIGSLDDLSALLDFYDWWQTTDYSLDDLEFITGGEVEKPEAYPDASEISRRIVRKIKADQVLTFKNTLFAYLEGVADAHSLAILEHEENSGLFTEARGIRYRVSETFDPDAEPSATIVIPELPDEPPIPATPEQVGNLLATYHNPSVPVFDDTLFTAIENVTEDQSRAIVNENSGLIVPTPLENTFWLTEAFNPAELMTIPEGIPVTEADAKAILLTYHAGEVIPNYLAGEFGLPVEKIKGLISLSGTDLIDPAFTNALQGGDRDGIIRGLVESLLPLKILFKDDAFNTAAFDFISNPGSPFGGLDFNNIAIENIRTLSIYHCFLAKRKEQNPRQQLHDCLLAFDTGTGRFYPAISSGETETERENRREIQNALSRSLDAEVGLIITAHEEIPLPDTALKALDKL